LIALSEYMYIHACHLNVIGAFYKVVYSAFTLVFFCSSIERLPIDPVLHKEKSKADVMAHVAKTCRLVLRSRSRGQRKAQAQNGSYLRMESDRKYQFGEIVHCSW